VDLNGRDFPVALVRGSAPVTARARTVVPAGLTAKEKAAIANVALERIVNGNEIATSSVTANLVPSTRPPVPVTIRAELSLANK
jgi:hypothetical protein